MAFILIRIYIACEINLYIMKTIDNDNIVEIKRSAVLNSAFFKAHLFRNSFRGFWYDTFQRSYGIKLSFQNKNKSLLCLYMQDTRGEMTVFEYEIRSNEIQIGQIRNDKVIISTSAYTVKLIQPKNTRLKTPVNIEFTLQLLSHNSIYIHFTDYSLYSPPINHLRRGLVLARENKTE